MQITQINEEKYRGVARQCSRNVTRQYSTSFSLSIYMLHKSLRNPICAIYGLVRLADEIVDTFLDHDRGELLKQLKTETFRAMDRGLSTNPVIHNFQEVALCYNIEKPLVEAFFDSMAMDLKQDEHNRESFDTYIYGSAEVVGLMCLKVFCEGDEKQYQKLKSNALRLGAAFQKVNFLRDMRQDALELNRNYFPHVQASGLDRRTKTMIEEEIEEDFNRALQGIRKLPIKARFGVYVAYVYYRYLLKKIERLPPYRIKTARIRVPNLTKAALLCKAMVKHKLNWM